MLLAHDETSRCLVQDITTKAFGCAMQDSMEYVRACLTLTGKRRVDANLNSAEERRYFDVVMCLLDLEDDRRVVIQNEHILTACCIHTDMWTPAVSRMLARVSTSELEAALEYAHDSSSLLPLWLADKRLRWCDALQIFFEQECDTGDLTNVRQLLLAGSERLPPREVYEA